VEYDKCAEALRDRADADMRNTLEAGGGIADATTEMLHGLALRSFRAGWEARGQPGGD